MIVYPAAETAYDEMKLMSDPRTSEDDSDDDFTDTYEDNSWFIYRLNLSPSIYRPNLMLVCLARGMIECTRGEKQMNRLEYDLGSIIEYRNSGGEILKVKVDEKEDDIKNGRSGFSGIVIGSDDDGCWGYDSQIIRVIKK